MEQTALNFFDEKYFSADCLCDINQKGSCPFHPVNEEDQRITKTTPVFERFYPVNEEDQRIKKTTPVFEQEYFPEPCLCDRNQSIYCPLHKGNKDVESQKKSTYPVKLVEVNQSFPKQPTNDLIPFIEYRVKLFTCEEIIFFPGECKSIQTNTSITRKYGRLSLLIKTDENFPLNCRNESFLNPSFRGNVSLQFGNVKYEHVVIAAGSLVGDLIFTPFIE